MLAVGTELGESDLWGPPLRLEGAVVRVDVDPRQAHMNQRAAVAVIGDAADAIGLIGEALPGAAAGTAARGARCGRRSTPSGRRARRPTRTGSRPCARGCRTTR